MAIRIKTTWFRKGTGRAPDESASVLALNVWKVANKAVDDISKADFDIVDLGRGFGIIAEMCAYMIHLADRLLYGRVDEARRAQLIESAGVRLADYVAENIRDLTQVPADPRDYQGEFLDFLNRRAEDYATFDFPPEEPNFAVKRYLANMVRERMASHDQPWIVDQVIEFQAPEAFQMVKKVVDGLYPAPTGAERC